MGKKGKTKSQEKSSNGSGMASNQPERNLPQSKNRSMSPESGNSGEITHDSDKLRGTKLDTDHIPSNGTMDAVDNLTKALDKGAKIGGKRGIDQEKDRAKGQEEMKVGRSYADIVSKQRQKNEGSGENNLQPHKIRIANSPVYTGKTSRSLVGSIYQVKLLILLLKNAQDEDDDSFFLGTEVQEAKYFDDIVFQYKKNGKLVSCFLQAKHFRRHNKILFDDLINKEKKYGAFYLKKYFDSYCEIIKRKEEELSQPLTHPNREFVIYTNINFDKLGRDLKDSFQELKDKGSILNLVAKKGSQCLKFKNDFSKKTDLVSALKQEDNSITDQEIEAFFKHLVFAVNQPNEEELEEIIERKLGKQFNLDDASSVFSCLLNEGINIAKEEKKEKTFLSNQDIKKLFEKIAQEVATLVAIGPTALNRKKIKKTGLVYNQEVIQSIQDFLTEERSSKVLNLATEEIDLSAAKVNNVLDRNDYNNEDSCIFASLEDLLTLQYLVEAFNLKDKKCLLVVMCKPIKDEDVEQVFDKLHTTIQSCSNKQIIFITEGGKDDSLYRKIYDKFSYTDKSSGNDHYKEIADKEINFKDLTPKSQENLKERQVTFQGKTMNLGSLATLEFLNKFISGKLLIDLTQDKEIKVGGALPVSDHADIERTFGSQVVVREGALKSNSNDIFMIGKAKSRYFEKYADRNEVIRLNDNDPETHFKQVCEEKKEHNVHWLSREYVKRKLVLVHKKSQGSLRELRKNMNVEDDEKEDKFIQRKLAIITGEPGIGKSSTMERLLRQIRESNPLLWVVKINLVNCRSQLSKVNFDHSNLEGVADFLSENVQLNTKLEKELFKYKLWKKNEIALLFDGFDEIGSVYEEKILLLLKVLKDLPSIDKMYISTRPYMKDQLEDSLGVFSCELSPLKLQDQKKFLQYLFKKEISENSNVNEERISTFVVKLLESCSKILNEVFSLSNPLHLKMLVNFFEKDFQESYDNGNECSIKFDNFNFLDSYEYYLARKICIHIDKNSTIFKVKFAELLNKSDFLHPKNLCKEKRDALEALSSYKNKFAAIFLEILFREEKYSNQLKLDQEHKDDLHNIGTLHQCLYEYYVAKFFVDKCLEDPNNRDLGIFELLKKYYFHPDGKGMRHFFDLSVSRYYSLHMDVINGDFSKVETLIRSKNKDEETKLLKLDPQDKSILHLVREGDYKKFAHAVKEEAKNAKKSFTEGILCELIERKDKVFGYTAFEYAVRSGSWKIVDKLLELKGWLFIFSSAK